MQALNLEVRPYELALNTSVQDKEVSIWLNESQEWVQRPSEFLDVLE